MTATADAINVASTLPEQRRILKTAIPGPESVAREAERRANVTDGLGVTLPIFVEQMAGGIIVDVDGNQLVDLASGIAVTSVGSSHPRVVAAVQEQVAKFTHTCFMVTEYDGYVQVARRLNELTPGDFDKRTLLVSTGAEAVENAIKIARTYTGRQAVVTFDHAYHGRTLLTMTMTAKHAPYKRGFGPYAPEIYRVPAADPYRWVGDEQNVAEEAFDRFAEVITTQLGADHVAAVIAEPVIGEGGFIVHAPGFLKRVQDFCRANGIVFIADEIQCGLGRTGDMFASTFEGTEPDLITTAKALGGGLPISAVTGRKEIMDSVPAGGLGGTYAGSPVACAAAVAALDVIVEEDLPRKAKAIEAIVLPRLQELKSTGIVGDVRGRGAMLALEFVRPGGKTPAPEFAGAIAKACHDQGVLVLVCGTFGNVIRLLPPLVIGEELLTDGVDVLASAVRAVAANPPSVSGKSR
ncbi:4-aminobutyrate--2-oxoglutarate transaminase [Jatrophihabitans cynanchi]|uniref:(S)-3-amino-2-methylpropionate transaminase n=1 Tax=Jatrophihabitans cynanchi TaxID=2944128 RepID=A0ABY7K6T4_9ACTN|nr:4-aminobutyrate--2-oxoglutarate transaminase [Jatrophihabitans sp. SB3-54]WAX58981.1 4-aminobutyrate--2-oxoglutarate transaminase [Jatrophihabitans sp. SB3-54]